MLEDIYQLAAAFASISGEDAALRAACKAAEVELCNRLKAGISPEDCLDSFVCAAAWLAICGYEDASGNIQSFSMADVSITKGSSTGNVRSLRLQAETLMAPWCADGFQFLGVRS